jgi:predicted nucleic-acid-binding protein
MKLVDTNVLLRFFIEDDKRQAEAVRHFFEKAFQDNQKLFVSDMVVAEIVWYFERREKLSQPVIATLLRFSLDDERLEFENRQRIKAAITFYEDHHVDFIDAYQAAIVQEKDLEAVISFDNHFSRLPVKWINPDK